jgi:hypothetical protein
MRGISKQQVIMAVTSALKELMLSPDVHWKNRSLVMILKQVEECLAQIRSERKKLKIDINKVSNAAVVDEITGEVLCRLVDGKLEEIGE